MEKMPTNPIEILLKYTCIARLRSSRWLACTHFNRWFIFYVFFASFAFCFCVFACLLCLPRSGRSVQSRRSSTSTSLAYSTGSFNWQRQQLPTGGWTLSVPRRELSRLVLKTSNCPSHTTSSVQQLRREWALQRALQQIGKKCMVKSKLEILGKKKVKIIQTGYRQAGRKVVSFTLFTFVFAFFEGDQTDGPKAMQISPHFRMHECLYACMDMCVCVCMRRGQ